MMKKIRICLVFFLLLLNSLSALSFDEEFISACTSGNLNRARELLSEGANIEVRDGCDHQTALVFSANRGHFQIVEMLLKKGADINAQDDKGWTALSEASYKGRVQIVELLLKNKASTIPSTSWLDSKEHGNAIFWCIESSHNKYEEKLAIVKLLLESNAEPEGVDYLNRNSLEIAKTKNYRELVELLEKYKAERIARLNEYALLEAIRNQDINKVKIYLEKKVNPNALLPNGESILNYAVSAQNYAIVKELLTHGANPNTANELGTSALMAAVRYDNEALISLLLANGVNVNKKDNKGRTALFYAAENSNIAIINMLMDAGASVNSTDIYEENVFLYACSLGNIPVCKFLMQKGCSISGANIFGINALHVATQKGLTSLIKLILDTDEIDIYAKDDNGNTALYYAQKNGNQEIIEILEKEIETY